MRKRKRIDYRQKRKINSPNNHDLSKKRTVERADEISYLLIQVKNNTGRVRGSHHPLQVYLISQILENKEKEGQREKNGEKTKIPERAGYELTAKEG